MLKKIIVFMLLSLTTFFSFSIETKANFLQQPLTFNYTNIFSNMHILAGTCNTVQSTDQILFIQIAPNDHVVNNRLGVNSQIQFYSTANCTGTFTSRLLNFSSASNIDNNFTFDFNDPFFTSIPVSFGITLATNLTGFAPSGFMNYMNTNSFRTNFTPNVFEMYNGFSLILSGFYADFIRPLQTAPTKSGGFTFTHFADINGNVFDFEAPILPNQISPDGIVRLYAQFDENILQLNPGLQGAFPITFSSTRPIDIILFNTGFYNTPGFIFLYSIIIIVSSIAIWYLKGSTLVSLIADIIITVIFMISGYFPVFASIIMIMLFVVIIISINKSGGLLNE